MKMGIGVILVMLTAILWWLNWSPQAQACFARGGTSYELDGRCFRVIVTTAVVRL